MFLFKIAAFIFLFSFIAFSQNSEKTKKVNFQKVNSLLKTEYPGDSTIDIKYYKLDLKVIIYQV